LFHADGQTKGDRQIDKRKLLVDFAIFRTRLKTGQLMPYREIIAVCSVSQTKQIQDTVLAGRRIAVCIKLGGALSNQRTLQVSNNQLPTAVQYVIRSFARSRRESDVRIGHGSSCNEPLLSPFITNGHPTHCQVQTHY